MRYYFLLEAFAMIALGANLHAAPVAKADSTMVYAYSAADGANGLHLALQNAAGEWRTVDKGRTFVSCEFGAWDFPGKRMNGLQVRRMLDDTFCAVWGANEGNNVQATAATPDLVNWHVQNFSLAPEGFKFSSDTTLLVDGNPTQGSLLRLSNAELRRIMQFIAEDKRQAGLSDETCSHDYERYAGIGTPQLEVAIDASSTKPISDKLIGIFFEDLSHAADGGLYGEQVQNRDFEYSAADQHKPAWDATYAWQSTSDSIRIASQSPLHANNPHYALLSAGETIENAGYDGIVLHKGEKYDFSVFTRAPKGASFEVVLRDANGQILAKTRLKAHAKDEWQQLKCVLTPKVSCDSATLALSCNGNLRSEVAVDMVSLFPRDTFKGRRNGLRRDLAQTLADLHPRFVRFPGGCVAHGDGLDDAYDWKGSVGPLYARRPLRNTWGYHQSRGLGYYEYFQFCEDIGAEPLPVLAAGVSCQHSHTPSHHTCNELTLRSQQGGVPMEEMAEYVQNFIDLVEFANGPVTSEWGKLRADMGHPEPFNLKYIGIGNEDMITEVFKTRFKMIYDALRQAHPEIIVVGTAGPSHQGSDHADGWEFGRQLQVPILDEHYYEKPGWFVNNRDYYDSYDRQGPHVYLGEYAAHLKGRPANVETALTEALYLTDVERNGDVVEMTSYAPLLAKEGHINWSPDLIYFNNTQVKPTVGYYAQQLFSQNAGTEYADTHTMLSSVNPEAAKRVGVSTVFDPQSGDYIVKMVNLLPCATSANIAIEGADIPAQTVPTTILSGIPTDKTAKPVSTLLPISGPSFTTTLEPYSLTVMRIHKG